MSASKSVRITSQGQMKNWVKFALESFEKNENVPIVFHTLPVDKGKGKEIEETTEKEEKKEEAGKASTSLSPVTKVVPRLISVVEIIKREYIKTLELRKSTRLVGLHQYNEFGIIGSDDSADSGLSLAETMQGKHYPKKKHTPYMRITLSTSELPELLIKGATYQPPIPRTMSRSAKNRAKKKKRKEEGHNVADDANLTSV